MGTLLDTLICIQRMIGCGKEYDDKEWYNGLGAWGAENRPYPIHSTWTVADIYIRRHFNINDKKEIGRI